MKTCVGLAILLVGCSESGWVPRLTIPQYEQAKESVQGGVGRRYEDHNACRKTATDADNLVVCMQTAGYDYVGRSADDQATECWRLRDKNSTDPLPDPWCFRHRQAAP